MLAGCSHELGAIRHEGKSEISQSVAEESSGGEAVPAASFSIEQAQEAETVSHLNFSSSCMAFIGFCLGNCCTKECKPGFHRDEKSECVPFTCSTDKGCRLCVPQSLRTRDDQCAECEPGHKQTLDGVCEPYACLTGGAPMPSQCKLDMQSLSRGISCRRGGCLQGLPTSGGANCGWKLVNESRRYVSFASTLSQF